MDTAAKMTDGDACTFRLPRAELREFGRLAGVKGITPAQALRSLVRRVNRGTVSLTTGRVGDLSVRGMTAEVEA